MRNMIFLLLGLIRFSHSAWMLSDNHDNQWCSQQGEGAECPPTEKKCKQSGKSKESWTLWKITEKVRKMGQNHKKKKQIWKGREKSGRFFHLFPADRYRAGNATANDPRGVTGIFSEGAK